ncbi:MAG: hypothetical protein M9962_12390 [Oligoflexia bacterium]|nr:hypothetical protein [Oligoflexia bacterium]
MEYLNFKGFNPDDALKNKAYLIMDEIIERSPSDAKVVAIMEKIGEHYYCNIEVGSISFPFTVETSHRLASVALEKAQVIVLRKLERWCKSRLLKINNMSRKIPLRLAKSGN